MRSFIFAVIVVLFCYTMSQCNANWSSTTTNMTYARQSPATAVVGNRVFVLGGTFDPIGRRVVEIYDAVTGQWATTELPGDASGLAVGGSIGSVAAFATSNGNTFIYNDSDQSWTLGAIAPRRLRMAVASSSRRIFFAGGYAVGGGGDYDTVDVYEPGTGLWSVEHLSVSRWGAAGASSGDTVLFAGGDEWNGPWQDRVDILDDATGIWSATTLSGRASVPAATSVGNRILIGGGYGDGGGDRTEVDILNVDTGEWEFTHLSQGRSSLSATSIGDYALFGGGWVNLSSEEAAASDVVDIYDLRTQQWGTQNLSVARYDVSAVTVHDKVLFAGGVSADRMVFDVVDIFTIPEPSSFCILIPLLISIALRRPSLRL